MPASICHQLGPQTHRVGSGGDTIGLQAINFPRRRQRGNQNTYLSRLKTLCAALISTGALYCAKAEELTGIAFSVSFNPPTSAQVNPTNTPPGYNIHLKGLGLYTNNNGASKLVVVSNSQGEGRQTVDFLILGDPSRATPKLISPYNGGTNIILLPPENFNDKIYSLYVTAQANDPLDRDFREGPPSESRNFAIYNLDPNNTQPHILSINPFSTNAIAVSWSPIPSASMRLTIRETGPRPLSITLTTPPGISSWSGPISILRPGQQYTLTLQSIKENDSIGGSTNMLFAMPLQSPPPPAVGAQPREDPIIGLRIETSPVSVTFGSNQQFTITATGPANTSPVAVFMTPGLQPPSWTYVSPLILISPTPNGEGIPSEDGRATILLEQPATNRQKFFRVLPLQE